MCSVGLRRRLLLDLGLVLVLLVLLVLPELGWGCLGWGCAAGGGTGGVAADSADAGGGLGFADCWCWCWCLCYWCLCVGLGCGGWLLGLVVVGGSLGWDFSCGGMINGCFAQSVVVLLLVRY